MSMYRIRPEVIDQARQRLGVTSDEQLAARLGMTGGTVSRYRRGRGHSFDNAVRILDAAGMPVSGVERVAAPGGREVA